MVMACSGTARLQQADGIGVATLAEALEARNWCKNHWAIEGAFTADEWQTAIAQDISCVIHHPAAADGRWTTSHLPQCHAWFG